MTQKEFNELPLLLRRKEVVQCGIEDKKIDSITLLLKTSEDTVPFGKIGAIVSVSGRHKNGKDKYGYKKYRKIDLARMCGFVV